MYYQLGSPINSNDANPAKLGCPSFAFTLLGTATRCRSLAQGRPMLLRKQKRPSTSREEATSPRCKFAKLASETGAAIANLLVTHRYSAERLQELTRIEKALQRPFQQIVVRRAKSEPRHGCRVSQGCGPFWKFRRFNCCAVTGKNARA